ncbi:MAG: type I polyketide synthase, partial [Candidatus Latescibacteria bacterium]|nr:type I polyketide synthase [Candidatus Latescibacterota bacterium]
MTSDEKDSIAIIGMGCRFPGGADSPAAFWQLLRDGVDAITDVPPDRWNLRPVYDPDRAAPGTMCTRWGGFVGQIDRFDAQFFGIAPREASRIDPQQRLLLEVAWEALEDAGLPPENAAGTNTGVFIGITTHDYYDIQLSPTDRQDINAYTNLGGHLSIAANRVSYVFDFHGPSMAIETACSSSLVAVHLACQSLLQDECPLALAGGVNVLLKPEVTIGFSQASMLSPDGRCRSFDARANGYVRSEGAGLIVLKPFSRAVADGDPIYAVIRGSAVNEDGRTRGITVPSPHAQESLLRAACDRAGVSPEQVQYVEAHGTGTPAGDPVEAVALGAVFGQPRPPGDDCVIGSVKTNLGHLEPAAGVAGLMKVALMLTHQQIPPHLHFETPHPDIPFEELRLRIPRSLETWLAPRRGPRLAGVSSFGFGGANAHAIVEEAPPLPDSRDEASAPGRACILPLSARSQTALQARVRADLEFLKETASTAQASLRDVCSSASLRRGHHDYRLAVVAHSREELVEHLEAFLRGETRTAISSGHQTPGQPPRLVFVFTGMGPQWWGMGRQLLDEEPVFREAVEQCDAVFQQYTGWSVLEELTAEESRSRIAETHVAQPANFVLQVGLTALWRSWGIVPDGVVGHSVGEMAAAHAAGALSLEDAVQVVYHRSRLQQRTAGHGTMAAIGLSVETAECVVRDYEGRVSIAALNSPSAVTLSGDAEALNEIARSLASQGMFCRFLQVDVPYHSPQMEPLQDELLESLRCLQPRPAAIPLFSTVTGQQVDGSELDAAYWWRNVRAPVRFAAAIDALIQTGSHLFLEIGPHPVLAASIQECLAAAGKDGTVLYTLRRQEPERATMLGSLGILYTLGYLVDWKRLYPSGGRFVRLPSYPWQRERHWQESEASRQARLGGPAPSARSVPGTPVHPLLGARLQSAWPVWDAPLDTPRLAYLADHRVQGAAVYPAAAYVEMALAAGRDALDGHTGSVEEVEFHRPLFLTDGPPPALQLVFDPASSSFEVYSQAQHERSSWVRHVTGKLFRLDHRHAPEPVELDAIRQRCRDEVSGHACYQQFQQAGLHYGPCFQAIEHLWRGHDEALACVQIPEQLQPGIDEYILHPTLLDACFQTLLAASSVDTISLPVRVERIRVYHPTGLRAWAYACVGERTERTVAGDIRLCDETGRVLADVQGVRCQSLMETEESAEDRDSMLYEYRWEQDEARPVASVRPEQTGRWLIFADREGVGQHLADRLSACHQSVLLFSPG